VSIVMLPMRCPIIVESMVEGGVSDISCLGTRNRNKTAKVPNPRELIGTVHLERMRGRRSALSGRVPTGKRPSEFKLIEKSGFLEAREPLHQTLRYRDTRYPDTKSVGPQKSTEDRWQAFVTGSGPLIGQRP
jgi:hypothetical protein